MFDCYGATSVIISKTVGSCCVTSELHIGAIATAYWLMTRPVDPLDYIHTTQLTATEVVMSRIFFYF